MLTRLVTPILLLFCVFMTIFFMVLDIIMYIGEKGCHLKGCFMYYTMDDPFGFRIEQLFGFFTIGFTFLLGLFPLIRFIYNSYIDDGDQSKSDRDSNNILEGLIIFFSELVLIFGFSCFGLLFSCISIIKEKLQPKVYDDEFEAFIHSTDGNPIFKKFAKLEWSLENILFYESVENLKFIPSEKYAERRTNEIIDAFIDIGAPLEVNLSVDARKETIKNVENFKTFSNDYKKMFEPATKETKRNMRDTFSRVVTSSEFKKWKKYTNAVINK
jgi:hypothetical protein